MTGNALPAKGDAGKTRAKSADGLGGARAISFLLMPLGGGTAACACRAGKTAR